MKKRTEHNVGRDGLDQISDLPDHILGQILSLLPTEEAVRTSFLCKRWKFLWTSLPVLDLDFNCFSKKSNMSCLDDRKRRFMEFVECVFSLHDVQHLQKLRLAFDIAEFRKHNSQIRIFVKFAMRSDCSTLDLDFLSGYLLPIVSAIYTLPPCSFPHRSVTDLKLTECKFIPSLYKRFVSVKTAILTRVELPKDSLHDLISKCPCLEELHLIECKIPSHLEFRAPESNLKCLLIRSRLATWFSHLSVNVPNLLRFNFAGMMFVHFSVSCPVNLIEATLNLHIISIYNDEVQILCNLLKNLRNVKILSLSAQCLEVLSLDGGKSLATPLYNLKHLKVKLTQDDKELLGLTCLLRSAPYLETLSVKFSQFSEEHVDETTFSLSDVNEETFRAPKLIASDSVSHLKKVEIKGFNGRRNEMEFVRIMLKNSLCLKKMVICKENMRSRYASLKQRGNKDLLNVLRRKQERTIENLLALTRASPDAQILLT